LYDQRPEFHPPTDQNARIWRYMSLGKLASLLDKEALFFARSDRLGDPFEGSSPIAFKAIRSDFIRAQPLTETIRRQLETEISSIAKMFRRFVCINCWHINSTESAAMWKLYSKTADAIAVQSTFHQLVTSFKADSPSVYVGKVNYGDYDSEAVGGDSLLGTFLWKRLSFEHERELRAVVQVPTSCPPIELVKRSLDPAGVSEGLYVPVDTNVLIERIHVYPAAPGWFREACQAVVEKFGLSRGICVQSRMDKEPFF